jgi:hypothetical protein
MYLVFACVIAWGASALTSAAQTSVADAEPGGAAPAKVRKEPPQTMVLNLGLFGGGADELTAAQGDGRPAPGLHTDGDALMTYRLRAGRATFAVNARSVLRYDGARTAPAPIREQGGLEFSLTGSHSQLRVSQSVSYSPYYQFGALPDAALALRSDPLNETAQSHGDFANTDLKTVQSMTGIDWSQTINRLYTLSVGYDVRRTTFGGQNLDLSSQDISVLVVRRLSRHVSLRTGYGQRFANSTFAQTTSVRNHDLDLGLDYRRALSGSRRTTVGFRSGAAVTPQNQGTAFNLTGSAELTRQMGRTWSARVAFDRTVQPLEGFTQPLLSNAVTSTVTGALGRRARVSSSAGFTTGTVGLGPTSGNTFSDWTGAAALHVTLTRRSALEAQYFWYGHRFGTDVLLAPGLANGLSRNGLRVGITWRAPLLGHLRG